MSEKLQLLTKTFNLLDTCHRYIGVQYDLYQSSWEGDPFWVGVGDLGLDQNCYDSNYEDEREQEMLWRAHQWDCLGWWNYIDHRTEELYKQFREENPLVKISRANWMLLAYQDAVSQGDSAAVERIADHLYYVEGITEPITLPV